MRSVPTYSSRDSDLGWLFRKDDGLAFKFYQQALEKFKTNAIIGF
jgi:hypothetical protein